MTDVAEHLKDLEHALRIAADDDEKLQVVFEIGTAIGGFNNDSTAQFAIDRSHDRAVHIYGLDPDRVTRALGEGRSEGRRRSEEQRAENAELDRKAIAQAALQPQKRSLDCVRASEVAAEKIEWIWPGRIARGKHTLIAGDPGTGKSQAMISIVAAVTTGGEWPCGEGRAPLGSVIILQAEDGVADTVIPRLMAAGADLTRVHIIKATRIEGVSQTFDLHSDLDLLKRKIVEIGDVILVCIDPVSSYMGGKVDSHKNSEVRSTLEPIGRLGEECRVAILSVTHFNKAAAGGGGQKVLYRVVGSIAFIGAPRAAFVVTEDPEDNDRCLLLQIKNNIAPRQQGLAYRKLQTLVEGDIVASHVHWDSRPVSTTADAAMGGSGGAGELTTTDLATEFLQTVLADGPIDALDIQAEAITAGLLKPDQPIGQAKPFRDARTALGVVTHREGFGPGAKYRWALPSAPWVPSTTMDAPSKERGIHGSKGHP
jgi:putative DNA primase/helicase